MVQSPLFWLALALTVPLYWAVKPEARPWVLAGGSAGLLCTLVPWVVIGLGVWTAAMVPLLRRGGKGTYALFFGGLVGQLVLFKTLALFPDLSSAVGGGGLVVPLGVSFFTFRLLHYGAETARGALPPHRTADVLAWILFFPIFTAGPIARFNTFQKNAEPTWTSQGAVAGLHRIAQGLVKRFVFAELLTSTAHKGTTGAVLLDQLDTMATWEIWGIVIISFLRLWFDFSGYTDIALGAAKLYGLKVEENFHWPVLARNPADFWRRWHISLAGWCQAYVYMPLIGLTRRPTLATLITFLTIGLWHAVSIHWVMWGAYHGIGVALTGAVQRRMRRRGPVTPRPALAWVGVPFTFLFVSSAHAFTTVDGAGNGWDAIRVWVRLFGVHL